MNLAAHLLVVTAELRENRRRMDRPTDGFCGSVVLLGRAFLAVRRRKSRAGSDLAKRFLLRCLLFAGTIAFEEVAVFALVLFLLLLSSAVACVFAVLSEMTEDSAAFSPSSGMSSISGAIDGISISREAVSPLSKTIVSSPASSLAAVEAVAPFIA